MKRKIHILPLFAIIFIPLLWLALPVTARHGAEISDSDKRKAEYIFLEAVNAYEAQRFDDYYLLLKRANQLDPEDPYINGALAEIELISPVTDSIARERAYTNLKARFEANPADYHNAVLFASVAKEAGRFDDMVDVWSTLDSIYSERTDPAMNLASVYLVKYIMGDSSAYDKSIAIYDRLQKGLGTEIGLSSQKIRAYMVRHDTIAVTKELEFLHNSAPADINVNLFVGANYAQINMPDSAISYFDRAAAIDSTYGAVYLTRAGFFQHLGDSIAYDREVFHALKSPTLEFDAKFELLTDYVVKLYSDTLQRPRIEELFSVMQDVNPGEAELHYFYGAYKSTIGDTKSAAEQYAYSVALEPDNAEAWQALVASYVRLEDNDKILESAREAMKHFPTQLYYPIVASGALVVKEDSKAAVALLDSVNPLLLENDMQRSVYHSQKGDILYRLEMEDSAFTEYAKAIDYNPENYMAMNNAAYYMSVAGKDLERAKIYASIAVSSEPTNTTYLDTYAWVQFKLKNYTEARKLIDQALAIYGILEVEDSICITTDSTCSDNDIIPNSTTDTVAVEEVVASQSNINPPTSEIYDHAGDIYFMSGEPKKALEFWKQAEALDPKNESIKKKVKHKTYFFE